MNDNKETLRLLPRRRLAMVVASFALLIGGATAPIDPLAAEVDAGSKPNVVLIFVDDADRTLLSSDAISQYFPNIDEHLLQSGMYFENFVTSTPLCGPIRASLFRGQYAHSTEIKTNIEAPAGSGPEVPTGSWSEFYGRGYADDEIGVWMQAAGYRTMMVGKYHHDNFPGAAPEGTAYIAPGWDEFYASRGVKYYETNRMINGQVQRLRPWPLDYRTDVESEDVVNLLQAHDDSADGQPFFMYFAPAGPHGPGSSPDPMYAQRHANLFTGIAAPQTPGYDEGDYGDKPLHMQDAFAPMSTSRKAAVDTRHQDRLRAMLAVDEAIGAIFAQLEATEELEKTVVILASDNGYSMGSHRIPASKKFPYDEIYAIPMLIRAPESEEGVAFDHLVTVADFAPTLLDLAGAPKPAFIEGQSMLPLLREDPPSPSQWRTAVTVENWSPAGPVNADYRAIRMANSSYIEWQTGEKEYYDHATDPFELENRYGLLTRTEQAELAALLNHHENCSGPECNQVLPAPNITSLATSVTTSIDLLANISKRGNAPTSSVASGYTMQGTVSAEDGVKSVLLVVKNRNSGMFWNGQAWQSGYARVAATISNPGTVFSPWTFKVPAGPAVGDRLTVTARGYSNTFGRFDRSVARLTLEING